MCRGNQTFKSIRDFVSKETASVCCVDWKVKRRLESETLNVIVHCQFTGGR